MLPALETRPMRLEGEHRAVRGIMRGVATTHAELSSIASTLTELTERVTALAERARDGKQGDLAVELFAVERELRGALRRLGRASPGGQPGRP